MTSAAAGEPESAAGDANGRPTPRIYVPSSDLAVSADDLQSTAELAERAGENAGDVEDGVVSLDANGPAKRKRSRRGSRGGKKRDASRPLPVALMLLSGGRRRGRDGPEAPLSAEAPAYAPMSEWIDDFETRSCG